MIAGAALMLASGTAHAVDKTPCPANMVCASAPTTVGAALIKAGYQGLVTKADDGDPEIESAASGYKFWVEFYGCDKNAQCDSLQFYAVFEGNPARDATFVNEWNSTKRFSQLSVRKKDGKMELRYDVSTIGGLNAANFADVVDWWATMLGGFGQFLSERPLPEKK